MLSAAQAKDAAGSTADDLNKKAGSAGESASDKMGKVSPAA